MNTISEPSEPDMELISEWPGDAMKRKRYSAFLGQYITERMSKSGEPLTIALDAGWGSGKTFFVKHWCKDIEAENGAAIVFDAWKNDFSDEVLISFIAELSIGMKRLRERVKLPKRIKAGLVKQSKNLLQGFRRAAVPAASVVSKGLFKMASGVAFAEISEAIDSDDWSKLSDIDFEKATEGAGEHLEKGLEKFFEKALEAHDERAKASEVFRAALELLVKLLQEADAIQGPLYIFVDELDRCRPDYAIKLLEGIKHLFAVTGVVFVVSTNLDQLSKSVQAVYGANFDGHSYLKRFFDFEFTLPEPDFYSFGTILASEIPMFQNRQLDFGLNEEAYPNENLLARSFELVAMACGLSLRTQRQVWMIAAAASVGIPATARVSSMWLFFLSAMRHSHPQIFEKLGDKELQPTDFQVLCRQIETISKVSAKVWKDVHSSNGVGTRRELREIPIQEVLFVYHRASFEDMTKLERRRDQSDASYPANLTNQMCEEKPSPFNPRAVYHPAIKDYPALVKMAGLIG